MHACNAHVLASIAHAPQTTGMNYECTAPTALNLALVLSTKPQKDKVNPQWSAALVWTTLTYLEIGMPQSRSSRTARRGQRSTQAPAREVRLSSSSSTSRTPDTPPSLVQEVRLSTSSPASSTSAGTRFPREVRLSYSQQPTTSSDAPPMSSSSTSTPATDLSVVLGQLAELQRQVPEMHGSSSRNEVDPPPPPPPRVHQPAATAASVAQPTSTNCSAATPTVRISTRARLGPGVAR